MKRVFTPCAAVLCLTMALSPAALAAGPTAESQACYPTAVYQSEDGTELKKIYDLSPEDDPAGIPRSDFEQDCIHYTLTDLLKQELPEHEERQHTETVSLPSKNKDMGSVLALLPQEREFITDDGMMGTLTLQLDTVKVEVAGYGSSTKEVRATRSYPNLSEADLSLIPKSIEEKGKTLTLADVQWSSSEQTDGAGGTVTRYTAAASYTGTSSYQYATGYTVTANYTGEVAKTGCSVVTYTAIFGSMEAPEESTEPESGSSTASAGVDLSTLKMPLLVGGVVVILAAGGVFVFKKLKERR